MVLRYYQVIMPIDIFQYSNMYTLRKSVQWLADETHVKEECGPYVTKPGNLYVLVRGACPYELRTYDCRLAKATSSLLKASPGENCL